MNLTGETKLFLGIIIATIVIVVVGVFLTSQPVKTYTREEMIPTGAYTEGTASAKIFLVEFSDYECPACKAFQPTLSALIGKYKDKMVFAYRHFPLDQHPLAQKAALVAEAAGVQGKFWEMHDLLFENQDALSDSIFTDLEKQLKLDDAKFQQSLQDSTLTDKINADKAFGEKVGIDATPTFFLQGKKLDLATPADLTTEVENAIKTN
jgi:protein-disulfide isomerase